MATHNVTHRDGAAHGVYDDQTKKITLSPGSILTIDLKVEPHSNIAQNYRAVAEHMQAGNIKVIKGRMQVVKPIPNLSPSAARVFVDGKTGSGREAWTLRNGSPLATIHAKKARTRTQRGLVGSAEPTPALPTAGGGPSAPRPRAFARSATSGGKLPLIPPPAIPPPTLPRHPTPTGVDFAEALVKWIHSDPYFPPLGRPSVIGWDERIKTYAYATKANPPAWLRVYGDVNPLISGLKNIIAAYNWNAVGSAVHLKAADDKSLQSLAQRVCTWGGVRQRNGYANAWKVIKSAVLSAQHHGAPMNSGWTKVASFATDGAANSQTIWDSRVATSLIWRLDQILFSSRLVVGNLRAQYAIGLVEGKANGSGMPRHRTYNFAWPDGYGKWSCHFAGGQLVRDMVNVLNDPTKGYPSMPTPAGGAAPWDVFGVGLVLFMDGR
jgi:hypothetical protein